MMGNTAQNGESKKTRQQQTLKKLMKLLYRRQSSSRAGEGKHKTELHCIMIFAGKPRHFFITVFQIDVPIILS